MNELGRDASRVLSPGALLSGLDLNLRALFAELSQLEGGTSLLRLLNQKANALLTIDDLAYYLEQSPPAVEQNLRQLVSLGWARRLELKNCTWFGLTTDPQRRQVVQELLAWQDELNAQLEQLRRAINGARTEL